MPILISNPVMADRWARLRALSIHLDSEVAAESEAGAERASTDGALYHFRMAIGSVGLVKPFDWPKWGAPGLTTEMVPMLDDEMSWKHVTRIMRADRFNDGVFEAYARSGSLTALVRHLYELRETVNGWPKSFAVNPDGSVPEGLNVFAGRRGTPFRAQTTGKRYRCPDCNEGWALEVLWGGGGLSRVCSREWHHMAERNEVHMLRVHWFGRRVSSPAPSARS